jgi:hypothetical protein
MPLTVGLATCTSHSGVKKAHDWTVKQLANLFHTTYHTKTQHVTKRSDPNLNGHLHYLREGEKKTESSTDNTTECVVTVQKGEEQVGSRGSCTTREMIYNRPSEGVSTSEKGTLTGISTMYHYQYEFACR